MSGPTETKDETWSAKWGYGACPVCGRTFPLTPNGTVWWHMLPAPATVRVGAAPRTFVCRGGGGAPMAVSQ